MRTLRKSFPLLCALVILTGCQRIVYLNVHNNSGVAVTLFEPYGPLNQKYQVSHGQSIRLRIVGELLHIESSLGNWVYATIVPHLNDKERGRGPFIETPFYTTVRVQLEKDGSLFALRPDWSPPIAVPPEQQPDGFPLLPID